MNTCYTWPIGVCSWSVRNDFEKIDHLMSVLDIGHVHLDLCPICIEQSEAYLRQVQQRRWTISCTMIGFLQEDYSTLETIRKTGGIVPDEYWSQNHQWFVSAINTTRQLGVRYLSSHIGFIDRKDQKGYQKLLDRMQLLADKAKAEGVTLLMETGQEAVEDLKQFLLDLDHPAVGINFDPANMILYGKGDPIEAVETLAPWVRHVHIKDAIATEMPGTWGSEVAWGTGQVDAVQFLRTLKEIQFQGALAVEREAGQSRIEDIKNAVEALSAFEG